MMNNFWRILHISIHPASGDINVRHSYKTDYYYISVH